jgi:hypothetical protein
VVELDIHSDTFWEDLEKKTRETEEKYGKTVTELLEEREKRVNDAIELRIPDRVPVTIITGAFSAKYVGLPVSSMYYDHDVYRKACVKTIVDFEPDQGASMIMVRSGLIMELLDPRDSRWPGGTLPPDIPHQFVEGEYMKAEEYDLFLNDPSDFMFRYYIPRTYGSLKPFSEIPPFRNMIGHRGFSTIIGLFSRPEFRELAEKLARAATEQERIMKEGVEFSKMMESIGYPSRGGGVMGGGGVSMAPFDIIADHLRGMRGAMLDMYRCPDKLLTACDKILGWQIEQSVPTEPDSRGYRRRAGMPLHRGSDSFMSLEQFEKFYWPGLKKAILTNVDLGYIAAPFWEGIWNDRLEYLLELPKGRVVFHCENTNIFRAKEILGDHMCIQGGVPPTILQAGTPDDVDEYCKKLIDVVGKDGGFILGPGSAIDYARPENIKAMIDAAKKYGKY